MISKAQEGSLRREATAEPRAKLSVLERSMLKWALIDPGDRVLDADIGEGLVAEYIRRNDMCEVCGVSQSIDDVKRARARLRGCDIVYADAGDIPWPHGSFDVALVKFIRTERGDTYRLLGELCRVLKEGGQLIIGFGSALGRALATRGDDYEAHMPSHKELHTALNSLGFTQITLQRGGITGGVLIAWKQKPLAEGAVGE